MPKGRVEGKEDGRKGRVGNRGWYMPTHTERGVPRKKGEGEIKQKVSKVLEKVYRSAAER